jgi:hypothetical protein
MRSTLVGGIMVAHHMNLSFGSKGRRMKEPHTTAAEETELRSLLGDATALAAEFLEGLPGRRVTPTATADELREELGGPLSEGPRDPRRVLAELARGVEPGLMATPGGRFFGFVIGGSLPAANRKLTADGAIRTRSSLLRIALTLSYQHEGGPVIWVWAPFLER